MLEGRGDVDSGSSLERNSWNIHEAQLLTEAIMSCQ